MRGAAGDGHVRDAQRRGLILVELERRDELACERLHLTAHRLGRLRDVVVLAGVRACRRRPGERKRALHPLCLVFGHTDRPLDRLRELRAAELQNARELADASVGDGDRRPIVTDRHGDACGAAAGLLGAGRDGRAEQGERLEVDAD